MKRYPKAEVDWAIEQTCNNVTTAHGQIVLAGEVLAQRMQSSAAGRCAEHGSRLYVAPGGTAPECWRCNEGAALRAQIHELQLSLRAATECPVKPGGDAKCTYRSIKQEQVQRLQQTNERLRGELADVRAELRQALQGGERT